MLCVLQVRGQRPARELTNDEVQLHLITQQDLLSNFSHKLQRSISVANQAAAKLKANLEGLSKDTADKVCLLCVPVLLFLSVVRAIMGVNGRNNGR
jgi:hypothetical protein